MAAGFMVFGSLLRVMPDAENDGLLTNTNGKRINALELGPRKKA